MTELLEMSFQTLQLFGDVGAVGGQRRFLFEAAGVEGDLGKERLEALPKHGVDRPRDLLAPGREKKDLPPQESNTLGEVRSDELAFRLSHPDERRRGLLRHACHGRDLLGTEAVLSGLDREYLGNRQQVPRLQASR